ncbi:hypothetical protein SUGI_0719290 [Cryptomeria japonica]|nr:hypothetical protein SUGI_0719290 [Cryptomeria japonica]
MVIMNGDEAKIDEDRWIIQIKESLQVHGEQEEENEISISIFCVPKELLAAKPEAYIPQCVSIGPYHYWRYELHGTERYKVAAARRFQKTISDCKFESVVEEVKKSSWQIRNCYHKYVDYKDDTLALLMALDTSFVLECLHFYTEQPDQASSQVFSRVKSLGGLLDPSGRSATHNEIMRDLMKLENQLPLFLLQKLLEMQLGSQDMAEERLCNLVRIACEEWSPFMFKIPESSRLRIKERGHILEVLYYSIVPEAAMDDTISNRNENEKNLQLGGSLLLYYVRRALKALWKAVAFLKVRLAKLHSALPQLLLKRIPVQLPTRLASTIQNLSNQRKDEKHEEKEEERGSSSAETPPTRDELAIPSVSDLYSAGVKFLPTDGDLNTILFDPTTATLYLPKLRLDSNTEVVLRNLVAFEASAAPGALIFTRYTDFLNGIIDTDEDVRLLTKSGILFNHLEDGGQVASLWNGMGKCVKLPKVKYLDQVIADINKYYNNRWNVAAKKYINKYIFSSWKLLTVVSAGLLLLVTCLQGFCSVYDCKGLRSSTSIS